MFAHSIYVVNKLSRVAVTYANIFSWSSQCYSVLYLLNIFEILTLLSYVMHYPIQLTMARSFLAAQHSADVFSVTTRLVKSRNLKAKGNVYILT